MRTPSSRGSFRAGLTAYDATWAFASPILALYVRGAFEIANDGGRGIVLYWATSVAFSLFAFLALRLHDGEARYFSVPEAFDIVKSVVVAELLTCLLLFTFTRLENIPRATPLIHALLLMTALIGMRVFARTYHYDVSVSRHRPQITEHIIIIGANQLAALYIRLLGAYAPGKRQVIAVLDDDPKMAGRSISGVKIVGALQDLRIIVDEFTEHGIRTDRLIIAGDADFLCEGTLQMIQRFCEHRSIAWDFLARMLASNAPHADAPEPAVVGATPSRPKITLSSYFRFTRFFNVVLALVLLVPALPMLAVASVLVLLDVGSPIFFWQQRVGKDGRTFFVHKFRTLKPPFDRHGNPIGEQERISRTGRWVRRLRLDEVPQLYNVIVGDMSLIGPRPLVVRDQPLDSSIRLMVRPGITGWAQVHGGARLTREEKESFDEWYVRNASLWLDLRIILLTLRIFFGGDSSDSFADAHVVPVAKTGALRSQKRLIFVNRYYFPDHSATSQMLTALTVHLAALGHDVHVITSRLHYQDSRAPRRPIREIIHGVHIHRIAATQFGRSLLIGRVIDYASFYLSLWKEMIHLAAAGDILIAKTDPPLLSVLAMHAAKRKGALLVNWWQDLYPEVAIALGVPFLKGPLGRSLSNLRDQSLKAAVANVVVGELMAKRVLARGASIKRVHVIPNWCGDEHIFPVPPKDNPLRKEWGLEDKFVVGYSGNLGRPHEFDTILSAAEQLKGNSNILFLLIGGGKQVSELTRQAKARGLDQLFRFIPYQKAKSLKFSLSLPDLHWISLKPELEGLIVPSKFYGIAAAGRPMIAITAIDGEIAQLVGHHQCGFVVKPGDADALVRAILALVNNPILKSVMGQRARLMLEANFTQASAFKRWRHLLKEIATPLQADIAVSVPQAVTSDEPVLWGANGPTLVVGRRQIAKK